MKRLLAVAGALAFVLAGCGSTFEEKAYKLGQGYELSQQTAIGYMEVAEPSAEITGKIAKANAKASPMVREVLKCARSLVAAEASGAVPPEAAELGLSAEEALAAKEEACEGLLSRALTVLDALDQAVEGS